MIMKKKYRSILMEGLEKGGRMGGFGDYDSRFTIYDSRLMIYDLRLTTYDLRLTTYDLRISQTYNMRIGHGYQISQASDTSVSPYKTGFCISVRVYQALSRRIRAIKF